MIKVYDVCMTRTNIDIDDDLIETVMKQNGLTTKREAVDFALRKTVRKPMTYQDVLKFRGIGYSLSNEELEALTPAER